MNLRKSSREAHMCLGENSRAPVECVERAQGFNEIDSRGAYMSLGKI